MTEHWTKAALRGKGSFQLRVGEYSPLPWREHRSRCMRPQSHCAHSQETERWMLVVDEILTCADAQPVAAFLRDSDTHIYAGFPVLNEPHL